MFDVVHAALHSALTTPSLYSAALHPLPSPPPHTHTPPASSTHPTTATHIQAAKQGNAFAIFPPSAAKNAGIVLMVAHQLVAFGLFILPVCVMWEKLVGTHYSKSTPWKVISRVPVGEFELPGGWGAGGLPGVGVGCCGLV